MKWSTIKYLFKEGLKGLWKNRLMAIASVGTIVLSLLILGMSYSVAQNVSYFMEQIETQLGITAYIDDTTDESRVAEIGSAIKDIPHIIEIHYISKEDALKSFSEDQDDDRLFLEFQNDNPLPASFDIKVDRIENQDAIVEQLGQYTELEVQSFKSETQIFTQINQSIQLVSLVIIGCLVIISLLLITNTIKLTVYVRRKEINIMKYIGATDLFIRIPFVIEGVMIGLIGALLPIWAIQVAYEYMQVFVTDALGSLIGGIQVQPITHIMAAIVPMFLGIGIGIGVIGSVIAIRNHLKV